MNPKVPVVVACGVVCLAFGVAAGVAGMMLFGYTLKEPERRAEGPPEGFDPKKMMPFGPGAPGGPGGPGGGDGKKKGFKGPGPKGQLVSLINKLEVLTDEPLTIKLNTEQKKKIGEQIRGLENASGLEDDDAEKRLKALLEVVKDHKRALERAGFTWPNGGGPGFMKMAPNPFQMPENKERLEALQERVGVRSKEEPKGG